MKMMKRTEDCAGGVAGVGKETPDMIDYMLFDFYMLLVVMLM